MKSELDQQYLDALDSDDLAAIDRIQRLVDAQDEANRARLASVEALAAAAVYYAKRGWAVFPCIPNEKRPATRHGLHDATTDTDQVKAWWVENPAYNVALRTGLSFDVIDIDGDLGWSSIVTHPDEEWPTKIGHVTTPRRPGCHWYVRPTGGGNGTAVLPGIDFRGAGGYVLAPPSRTEHGMYAWTTPVTDVVPE